MLNNEDKIRVENRDNSIVPETKVRRRFQAYETKEIPMGELRQMIQQPGCKNVIINHLIIHSQEAVAELLPDVEPEYFYNTKDVEFLLTRGSYDQLLDALDFAPEGVITLIKDQAVNTELNDMRKREAILDKTGFNVTQAIEIKRATQVKTEEAPKARRSAPIGEEKISESNAPVRRTTAPKYELKTQ